MYLLDVQQEKQHNELIQSVEGFNTEALRKTETIEKSVLPNAEGNLIATAAAVAAAECNALNSNLLGRKNVAQFNSPPQSLKRSVNGLLLLFSLNTHELISIGWFE